MKFFKSNRLKSLILSGALALSIFVTGCSSNNQNNLESSKNNIKTESNNTIVKDSNNNDASSITEVPKGSVEAIVERVVDGDTMKLKIKETGEVITLRLLLVDTPESVKQGVDPQPYSIEASNYAKDTLKSKDTVYIEYDEGDKTDKYDRHLGYLWFYSKENSSWNMFNEEIISKGYARVGYVYSQKRHLDKLNIAQDNAKSDKLNIWSVDGYVTNKGYDVDAYNKNNTTNNSSSSKDFDDSYNKSKIVYANGGSSVSNKYHATKDAHNMKGAIEMTEDKAKLEGYLPCGTCF